MIDETYQLYFLQGMLGITNGMANTIQTFLLGDLTIKGKRGKVVGKFNAIVSLASAAGLALGGYMVNYMDLNPYFTLPQLL